MSAIFASTRTDQFAIRPTNGFFLSGAMGIGTDSIANALTVVGNVSITNGLTASTIITTGSGNVIIDGGNFRRDTDPTIIIGANSDQHLRFRAGGATNNEIRMTILSSGEVGIGTSIAETAAAGNGGLRIKNNLLVDGNSTLGDTSTDQTTIVGIISGNNPTTSFNAGSATGSNSFAANESRAFGDRSFAEGWLTIASGIVSHAEGYDTRASNNSCHAEGSTTVASGNSCHAEGASTVASGTVSHAEGFQTSALGTVSHAEGQDTKAAGTASHAAGTKATAAQDYTYAWSDANLNTLTANVSTTRTGQYMVSASGGIFFPGNMGIGTDSIANALTVVGTISTIRGNSNQWNSTYNNVSTLSGNGTFNLYARGINLASTVAWTSAVDIPANINELTGGGVCLVTDVACIIKSKTLNPSNIGTTGVLFSTPPSFGLEDTSGNSHSSALSIGTRPLSGNYSRTSNGVGAGNSNGKFPYNGGAARIVSSTLPVFLTANLSLSVNNITTVLPLTSANSAFSNSDFHVKVDNEIMYVSSGGSSTSMTVARGQLGTTAAEHLSGALVTANVSLSGMLLVDACFTMKRFESF